MNGTGAGFTQHAPRRRQIPDSQGNRTNSQSLDVTTQATSISAEAEHIQTERQRRHEENDTNAQVCAVIEFGNSVACEYMGISAGERFNPAQ